MRRLLLLSGLLFLFSFLSVSAENYHYHSIACPFFTVTDNISWDELTALLESDEDQDGDADKEIRELWVSSESAADLTDILGEYSEKKIADDAREKIRISERGVSCAIIPLDKADPTMKLIQMEKSPFPWDSVYDPFHDVFAVPASDSNFDRNRVTTVLLTGTSAFARTVAYKMSVNGTLYPAEMIHSVFDASDITHISNEAVIWSLCPEPRRDNVSIQLCAGADTPEIFDYLGIDVIELTGNHLRDYDWKPFSQMLDLFDQKGYAWYGAGRNAEEAAKPLFIEHNGNRFVFLGCNCAGPDHVYADEKFPGVRHCDFDQMEAQIRDYSEKGYLVIVTLQYYEIYSRKPSDMQARDFRRLSEAGAVVVSGSQAHYPQIMVPAADRFIHYGLGNLFFDQMDVPVKGTRQEFLDRYVFYDGRLLNVQLISALLTDYSRPRLMQPAERESFLKDIFSYR